MNPSYQRWRIRRKEQKTQIISKVHGIQSLYKLWLSLVEQPSSPTERSTCFANEELSGRVDHYADHVPSRHPISCCTENTACTYIISCCAENTACTYQLLPREQHTLISVAVQRIQHAPISCCPEYSIHLYQLLCGVYHETISVAVVEHSMHLSVAVQSTAWNYISCCCGAQHKPIKPCSRCAE